MKIPTFKFHGSKARIAKWVFERVSFDVRNYYEPFAGRGNAFFYFSSKYEYNLAFLNDLNLAYFLESLQKYDGNYDFVPDFIDREVYSKFAGMASCYEKHLAESFCAYNGTFFRAGANLTNSPNHPSANRHGKNSTINRMSTARKLLKNVTITDYDYEKFLNKTFDANDLIYCDPPYINTDRTSWVGSGIDHERMVDVLSQIDCKIILSGYDNEIYSRLGFNKRYLTRASCAKNRNGSSGKAIEVVWENF